MLWLFAQQLDVKKQKCAENCQLQIAQLVNHLSKSEQPLEYLAQGIQPAAFKFQH